MGKQRMPRAIAGLSNSLERQDAEEVYAEFPKRAVFDALWELTALNLSLESEGGHQNAEDASADIRLMSATLFRAIKAHV